MWILWLRRLLKLRLLSAEDLFFIPEEEKLSSWEILSLFRRNEAPISRRLAGRQLQRLNRWGGVNRWMLISMVATIALVPLSPWLGNGSPVFIGGFLAMVVYFVDSPRRKVIRKLTPIDESADSTKLFVELLMKERDGKAAPGIAQHIEQIKNALGQEGKPKSYIILTGELDVMLAEQKRYESRSLKVDRRKVIGDYINSRRESEKATEEVSQHG